jgi:hypothetical protein
MHVTKLPGELIDHHAYAYGEWFLTNRIPFVNSNKKFKMAILYFQLSYYLFYFGAGKKLSESIVSEKLAACVNIVPGGNCVSLFIYSVQLDTQI